MLSPKTTPEIERHQREIRKKAPIAELLWEKKGMVPRAGEKKKGTRMSRKGATGGGEKKIVGVCQKKKTERGDGTRKQQATKPKGRDTQNNRGGGKGAHVLF